MRWSYVDSRGYEFSTHAGVTLSAVSVPALASLSLSLYTGEFRDWLDANDKGGLVSGAGRKRGEEKASPRVPRGWRSRPERRNVDARPKVYRGRATPRGDDAAPPPPRGVLGEERISGIPAAHRATGGIAGGRDGERKSIKKKSERHT